MEREPTMPKLVQDLTLHKSRNKRFIVCNLEYPDESPTVWSLHAKPPNPALYIEYAAKALDGKEEKIACAVLQTTATEAKAAPVLYHVQGFYTDVRKRPTLEQQRQLWGFRGVPLQPWQYRSFEVEDPEKTHSLIRSIGFPGTKIGWHKPYLFGPGPSVLGRPPPLLTSAKRCKECDSAVEKRCRLH
jgi:hypothetical protein